MLSLKHTLSAFAVLSLLSSPSSADDFECKVCAKPLPSDITIGEPKEISITSSEVPRTYLIVVPTLYELQASTPVIFSFHGGGKNSSGQLKLDQMSDPEFNKFAVNIYPQGIDKKWEGDPGNTANDIQLISDIIDSLEESYCIDTKRIWATGKSDGGGFCNTLACDPILSTKIAAFAPVSGAYYIDTQPCDPLTVPIPCSPGRSKIPVLEFHGGADKTIRYGGQASRSGECIPDIPHWVREWATRDGLGLDNVSTTLTEDTVVYTYGKGDEEGLVKHIFDKTLGHSWPSTVLNDDAISHNEGPASFNATPIILDWFQRHVLP